MKKIIEMFDIELLFKSFCFWIFLYSGFIALVEVSLYYILIPLAIHFIILHYSLHPQNEEVIKSIFGENPRTKLRQCLGFHQNNIAELNASCSIAHQAALLDSTDSTIEAIKLCSENSCKFVYLDVSVTIDNVALIHRKSNLCVENDKHNYSKSIEECDFHGLSVGFKSEVKDQNLCTMDEISPIVENLEVKVMFNVIHSSYYKSSDSVVQTILNVYNKYPFLYNKSVICSTNPLILFKIRNHNPSIVVAFKWVGFSKQSPITISWLKNFRYSNTLQCLTLEFVDSCLWWLLNNFMYRLIGISAVLLPKEIITPKIVENWERRNVRCIAGIVNLSTEKFYYANALGIAYLTDTLNIDS